MKINKRLESKNQEFLWDNLDNGKYRVVDKVHNVEADVVKDWKHKGRYELVKVDGRRFGGNANSNLTKSDVQNKIIDFVEESKKLKEGITNTEPVVKFQGKSSHTFTKDRKWEVDFDEAGNILARTRYGKPYYFKGHINDKVNDFPSTDEDNIILAAREQYRLKFGKIDEGMDGFVRTPCDACGKTNRVKVHFPSYNKGFDTTTYKCKYCNTKNELTDPHEYNDDGTLKEDSGYRSMRNKSRKGKPTNESKESEESELITQYINNGEFDKLEKVYNGTNVVWKLKDTTNESLDGDIEIATIADYIVDHYDFDDIDDKYSCINSIRDSFKGQKTISKEELEQFIGAHNGRDKMNEDTAVSSTFEYDDDVDDLTYYYDDEEFKRMLDEEPYNEIASKQVPDSDGFLTDYTMYRNMNDGTYVFIFGDKDIYTPGNSDFDWECDTEEEAKEWFDNYVGFDDDLLDEGWGSILEEAETETSPIVHKKSDGSYLVQSDNGDGYTAFNKDNVCQGHISASNETEAKNKFNSNKFDE